MPLVLFIFSSIFASTAVHVQHDLGIHDPIVPFPAYPKQVLSNNGPCLPVYRGTFVHDASPEYYLIPFSPPLVCSAAQKRSSYLYLTSVMYGALLRCVQSEGESAKIEVCFFHAFHRTAVFTLGGEIRASNSAKSYGENVLVVSCYWSRTLTAPSLDLIL